VLRRVRAAAAWVGEQGGGRRLALAILAGASAALAMPPVGAAPVLWISFPILAWMLDGAKSRWGAFAAGWGFGFGFFVAGLYWISWALTVDLPRFFWLIPFAIAGLPALFGLFTGTVGVAYRLMAPQGWGKPLVLAGLWGVAEWLRGHVATGFPWNLMGYAWIDWLPVMQSVATIGSYGLGVLTVWAATQPALLAGPRSRPGLIGTGAGLLVMAALAAAGTVRLNGADAVAPSGPWIRIIQPNIAQGDKWNDARRVRNFADQIAQSIAGRPPKVAAVIWPETAVPFFLSEMREPQAMRLLADAAPPGGVMLVGAPRATEPGVEPLQIWNSLLAVDGGGAVRAVYDKAHLVPFGEYVPFRGILPFNKVTPGAIDYSAGTGPATLAVAPLPPFSPLICYEVIFPGRVVGDGGRPAWLLNITNDGWYGLTSGPYQHFAIARARAIEEGLPLVRAANTGISGVVDAYGRVEAALALGTKGVIDAPLPSALAEPTVYSRRRDGGFWLLCLICVFGLFARGGKTRP
jgi:apolipoprotein N-acyltransferase